MSAVRTRSDWAIDLARTGARRLSAPARAIGYIGWTFAENLGDDVMWEAAQALLPDRRLETFRGVRREQMLERVGLSGKRAFDRIFLGGGTLINDGYLGVVQRALDFGVPVCTLGTGVGSSGFNALAEAPSRAWRDALGRFERIGVRGPRSLAALQEIGVTHAEIVGDLALAMTPDAPLFDARADGFLLNAAAPKQDDPVFATAQVMSQMALGAQRLLRLGLRPIPVAFCADDMEPLSRVMAQANISAPIAQPRTAAEFFALALQARLAFGIRLHSAVLSACAGLGFLNVAYRGKGKDFAASIDLSDWMADPADTTLPERTALLAEAAPQIGAAAHAAALRWREALKRYVADV